LVFASASAERAAIMERLGEYLNAIGSDRRAIEAVGATLLAAERTQQYTRRLPHYFF